MTPNVAHMAPGSVPRLRAIDEILDAVAFAYGVTADDLRGGARTKAIAEARLCAYAVARRCTRLSLGEIGSGVGGRDHTTVLAGVKSAARCCVRDHWFAGTLAVLLERFGEIEAAVTQ